LLLCETVSSMLRSVVLQPAISIRLHVFLSLFHEK
jgi:hypothetical protein